MKKLAFLLLITTLMSSCTDRGRLERKVNRVEGTWYFDRAFYKDDNAIFRNNIFDDFRGDEITFYEEGYADYYDASLNAHFSGSWVLTLHTIQFYEGDERSYTLDMEFEDYIHRENFYFYSDATKIGLGNMTLEVYDDFGFYTFKLNKL